MVYLLQNLEIDMVADNRTMPTAYAELNEVLHELVESLKGILTSTFVGAYLQGSFAIGDYDQHTRFEAMKLSL